MTGFGGEAEAPTTQALPSAPSGSVLYSTPDHSAANGFYAGAPESSVSTTDLESSTVGWRGSNAALTLVRGLKGNAVRVTQEGNRGGFAFYAAKRLVTKKAGAPYKARAYLRTTSPGMYLCLRVEERGGSVPRTTERCAPARSGWRRLALKGKAAGKGHKLVFSIHVMAAGGGTSFDVDGLRATS